MGWITVRWFIQVVKLLLITVLSSQLKWRKKNWMLGNESIELNWIKPHEGLFNAKNLTVAYSWNLQRISLHLLVKLIDFELFQKLAQHLLVFGFEFDKTCARINPVNTPQTIRCHNLQYRKMKCVFSICYVN